jgi:hypothetical protein
MILRNPPISNDPIGLNRPSSELHSSDKLLETQTSSLDPSSRSRWKSFSRSRSASLGLGVVVPIGQVGMVSPRKKRSIMPKGWDLGIQVRGEKGLRVVGCDYDDSGGMIGYGTVTILMSHGYCINFPY